MEKRNNSHRTIMNKRRKRNRIKRNCKIALLSILSLCTAFMMVISVKSQDDAHVKVDEASFHKLEQQYVQEVKDYLAKEGFTSSGVTLTKVYREDGGRDYEVRIHHKYIDKMNREERDKLTGDLEEISFPVPNCHFAYKLLLN